MEEKTREVVDGLGRGTGEVRMSGWAEMVRSLGEKGAKGEWLDHIHPGPVPASWLWADMMLYGQYAGLSHRFTRPRPRSFAEDEETDAFCVCHLLGLECAELRKVVTGIE